MRKMIEVKEYNTTDGKEVVLNNGLTIKDNGDIEVGKNAVIDGNVVLNSASNLVDPSGNPLALGGGLFSEYESNVIDCSQFTAHATKGLALIEAVGFDPEDLKPYPTEIKCKFINTGSLQGEMKEGYAIVSAYTSSSKIAWGYAEVCLAPSATSTVWISVSGSDAENDSYTKNKTTTGLIKPFYRHSISITNGGTTKTLIAVNTYSSAIRGSDVIKTHCLPGSTVTAATYGGKQVYDVVGTGVNAKIRCIDYVDDAFTLVEESLPDPTSAYTDTITAWNS